MASRELLVKSLWWFVYRRRLPRSSDEFECVFRLGLYSDQWKLAYLARTVH
jgi:hypothetical protein